MPYGRCHQCGRPAVVLMNGKVPFCIDCYPKILQAKQIEQTMIAETMNFVLGQMEAVAGLPGVLPRYEISQPAVVTGPVTLHNIQVDHSTVGSINTGEIQKLDVAVSCVRDGGNEALAQALQILAQATIDRGPPRRPPKIAVVS